MVAREGGANARGRTYSLFGTGTRVRRARPRWKGNSMLRKTAGAAFIALAMIFAARCHNDNNNALTNPPIATSTPVPGGPTSTPVPGAPTPTPAPSGQTVTVHVGANGGNDFMDEQTGTSESHIHVGDTIKWVWTAASTRRRREPARAAAPPTASG